MPLKCCFQVSSSKYLFQVQNYIVCLFSNKLLLRFNTPETALLSLLCAGYWRANLTVTVSSQRLDHITNSTLDFSALQNTAHLWIFPFGSFWIHLWIWQQGRLLTLMHSCSSLATQQFKDDDITRQLCVPKHQAPLGANEPILKTCLIIHYGNSGILTLLVPLSPMLLHILPSFFC